MLAVKNCWVLIANLLNGFVQFLPSIWKFMLQLGGITADMHQPALLQLDWSLSSYPRRWLRVCCRGLPGLRTKNKTCHCGSIVLCTQASFDCVHFSSISDLGEVLTSLFSFQTMLPAFLRDMCWGLIEWFLPSFIFTHRFWSNNLSKEYLVLASELSKTTAGKISFKIIRIIYIFIYICIYMYIKPHSLVFWNTL